MISLLQGAAPIVQRPATRQCAAFIPEGRLTVLAPAPVACVIEQDQCWQAHGTTQVNHGGVHADHAVQLIQHSSGVTPISVTLECRLTDRPTVFGMIRMLEIHDLKLLPQWVVIKPFVQ